MIKYYSLQDLLKNGLDIEPIIQEILLTTISAKTTYPEYAEWFINKHIPDVYKGTRNTIIAIHNNRIVGVANIKIKENKLCTLYFNPKYRHQGLGIKLVEESLEYLKNSKPLITMPSIYLSEFKNIIKRYDWQLTDCIDDCYIKGTNELVFNGELTKTNKELTNEERIILTYKHTKDKSILKLLKNPLLFFIKIVFCRKNEKNQKKVLSN